MDLQGQGVETLERVLTGERGTWDDGTGAEKGCRGGEEAEERPALPPAGPLPRPEALTQQSPSSQLSAPQSSAPAAHVDRGPGAPVRTFRRTTEARPHPAQGACVPADGPSSPLGGHGVTSFSASTAEEPKRLSAPPPNPGGAVWKSLWKMRASVTRIPAPCLFPRPARGKLPF